KRTLGRSPGGRSFRLRTDDRIAGGDGRCSCASVALPVNLSEQNDAGRNAMKMTAALLFEQGLQHPFTVSKPLRIERVELHGPGPGEVLIEVAAAGLCHSDLSTIEGVRPRKLPTVVGHEGAGVVREVGAGVKEVKAGDHVVTSFVSSCGSCRYCSDARP